MFDKIVKIEYNIVVDKLGIKKETKFCYSILESTKKDFIEKVIEVDNEKKCMIELRLDYLLASGVSIEEIIDLISIIKKKYTNKKLIATIRTIGEGGRVDLSKEKYFYFIKLLYLKTYVSAIDVEYKFYKIDKQYYDSLFSKKKKDIIISMHFFDRVFFENEYKNMFAEMASSTGNIIKFAIKTYTTNDLFTFMMVARKSYPIFKKQGKKVIFIAMGDVGKVSRIWHEFTNTRIVFLNAYVDEDKSLGQFNRNIYLKYRKLLAKKSKN